MATNPDTGWLDEFERVEHHPEAYPGTFNGAPERVVAHTTQGLSRYPAAVAAQHPNPPHLWVCPPSHPYAPRTKLQLYSLDVAARALSHPKGTPETNKMGALQVEIEGFAEDAAHWSFEDLDWLADEVIGPMAAYGGVDVSWFIQGVGRSDLAAGKRSSTRLPASEWATFGGLCSHQNVPDNDHWDAGGIDLEYISRRLSIPSAPTTPGDWFDMATREDLQQVVAEQVRLQLWHDADDGKVWMCEPGGVWRKWVDGPATFDMLTQYRGCIVVFNVPHPVIAALQDVGGVTNGITKTVDELEKLPQAISYEIGQKLLGAI